MTDKEKRLELETGAAIIRLQEMLVLTKGRSVPQLIEDLAQLTARNEALGGGVAAGGAAVHRVHEQRAMSRTVRECPRGATVHSMIITTTYRDIPWEEARKCAVLPDESKAGLWESRRGQSVEIHTPACDDHEHLWHACDGPFFVVASGGKGCICPHIASIGD